MGALQSLIDAPIDGYPTKSHRNSAHCCQSCGMQYDRSPGDSVMNQALWAHSHYLAELCGIWLGSPDSGHQHARHSLNKPADVSPFGAFPSTTLPKRSVSSSKPSLIVSTLIKHTDFTKNERSALKHGFFSTMDVNTAGLSDCSGLEGCHIRGCLYVEHGSLVFQAVDSSHQLPSVLTSRKEESHDAQFPPSSPADRRLRTRGSDPVAPGSNEPNEYLHPASRSSSIPISGCRKTRRRLWTYFQDGRASLSTAASHDGCRSYHGGRNNSKSVDLGKPGDPKCTNSDDKTNASAYKKFVNRRGDSQRPQEFDGTDQHGTGRLPPPPLRLSWPLCTLRRFGFYGNTLFKLEAGRRAPRGEGHYLFRIKSLKEFRHYFEHFVHRRKSLSPPKSPSNRPVPAALLRGPPSTPFYPNEFEAHHHGGPDSLSAQLMHVASCHPVTHNPVLDGLCQPPILCPGHGLPSDSDPDLLLNPMHMKQKANSLTHTSTRAPKISPTCLDWVRQQQEQQQQRSTHQHCFQNSCPHLSSSMFAMSAPKSRPLVCTESEADELISLPDPPPPPPPTVLTEHMDVQDFHKIYDNVDMDHLNSSTGCGVTALEHRTGDRPMTEDSVTFGLSRDWLTPSAMPIPPARGRLYTSRRAMTAFACSNLYPIPSRHHEEEETEEDEDREVSRVNPDIARCGSRVVTNCSAQSESLNLTENSRPRDQIVARKSANGIHMRHTSLPTPISVDTLFAMSSAITTSSDGCCSQANHSNRIQSLVSDTSPSMNVTPVDAEKRPDGTQHLPYYNLSSPEALCHLGRTNSSRSASIRTRLPSYEYPITHDDIMTANSVRQTESCALQANSICLPDPITAPDDSYGTDVVVGPPAPDTCSELVGPPLYPHCRPCMSSRADVSRRVEPISSSVLHYATLDFSPPSPDRARLSPDLTSTEPACVECTTEHCVHETNHSADARSSVCPMRVYGTFVHDPHLTRGNLSATGPRVRSLSSSGLPSNARPSSMGTADNELPANYVAICQLQTLAMRAVLNATT